MHSLEPELRHLHAAGDLDDTVARRAIALDRGDVFSVFLELRLTMYTAVLLIIAGVGLVIRDHLDRIGPVAILAAISMAATASYAFAQWPARSGRPRSMAGDYSLLLSALLVSAAVAFAEIQFRLLGDRWSWYLLGLAVFHAGTAYWLNSRLVLSVALAALAGWYGVEQRFGEVLAVAGASSMTGGRALACAATIAVGQFANHWLAGRPAFNETLEHFAANVGFWGGLAWCATRGMLGIGLIVTALLATIVVHRGLKTRSELLIAYGAVYSAIAICIAANRISNDGLVTSGVILFAVIGVAMALWRVRLHMRRQRA